MTTISSCRACDWNRKTLSGSILRALLLWIGVAALIVCTKMIPRATAEPRRIQLDDFAKQVAVSDPEISSDGKSIVFVISRANMNGDRHDRELK